MDTYYISGLMPEYKVTESDDSGWCLSVTVKFFCDPYCAYFVKWKSVGPCDGLLQITLQLMTSCKVSLSSSSICQTIKFSTFVGVIRRN